MTKLSLMLVLFHSAHLGTGKPGLSVEISVSPILDNPASFVMDMALLHSMVVSMHFRGCNVALWAPGFGNNFTGF